MTAPLDPFRPTTPEQRRTRTKMGDRFTFADWRRAIEELRGE